MKKIKKMEMKTKVINKKKLCLVFVFIIIAIYGSNLLKDTFSRYQSNGTSNAGADIAFWIVSDTIQEQNVALESLAPGETKECVFSVSNNNGTIRTNAALEYEIIINTTTNLPLSYEIYQKKSDGDILCEKDSETLYQDDDDTYYKEIKLSGFELGCIEDETTTFSLKATFPGSYDDLNLADLIECVNLKIDAKQKISE